jgi:hypothetical protein
MLKKWCHNQGFTLTENKSSATHTLFNGGAFKIPNDRLDEFSEKYAKSLEMCELLYWIERVPEKSTFKFFIDIDIKQNEKLNHESLFEIAQNIQLYLGEMMDTKECVVSWPEERIHKSQFKYGIHMNWPHLVVNTDMACFIAKNIQSEWKSYIDTSVYVTTTLRMIGSRKAEKCECWKKPTKPYRCENCVNGYIDTDGRYILRYVLNPYPDDILLRLYSVPKNLVTGTRIRTTNTQLSPFTNILYCPVNIPKPIKSQLKKTRSTPISNTNEFAQMLPILPNEIESVIKKIPLIPPYDPYYIVKTTNRYCYNVEREHTSSTVWYLINTKGIYQKCFSTKHGPDRKLGYCSNKCDGIDGDVFVYKINLPTPNIYTTPQQPNQPNQPNQLSLLVSTPMLDEVVKRLENLRKAKYRCIKKGIKK